MSNQSALTRTKVRAAWGFLTPMLIVLALVAGWPLLSTIFYSFTDLNMITGEWDFIGFENYYSFEWGDGLLTNPQWWGAVWNTVKFATVSVTLETLFGLGVALLLNQNFRGRGFLRAAVLVPWAIPTIVSAKMWDWMLIDSTAGIINTILQFFGIVDQAVAWTANPDTAMWAVIMVDVWKTTPFMALLILTGLQMLPSDCYEAAQVDGIHPLKVFWKVTLPLVAPAIMVAVIFRLLDALRIFDLIYVLTSGSEATQSMSVFARNELFQFGKGGVGSAASTLLFLVICILTIIYITVGKVDLGGDKK